VELPVNSNRRLVLVVAWMSLAIVSVDALWSTAERMFGWYAGHGLFYTSLASYLVAGWFGYDCGGILLAALSGAVVCIVDNLVGTYVAWLILPRRIDATLPSIPELAPMFAEAVLAAVVLGLAGGGLAMGARRWRRRRT
jgi:hypothetical protein